MLGSYYPPYHPTPGQVHVAPGVGVYYPIGAYYEQGVGRFPDVSAGGVVIGMAIHGIAGYLVGKQLGLPIAGAVATGLLGLPGLFVTALYASSQRKKGML